MRARRLAVLALSLSLLATPLASARADDGDADESRVGVLLAVVCGISIRAAIPAPVPWAGVAFVSCLFGFLDAALSPDPGSQPPPATP